MRDRTEYIEDDLFEDNHEEEEYDEDGIGGNCCMFMDREVFRCGAVGSEDCDLECRNSWMLGMTAEEAEARENARIEEAIRHEEWLRLRVFAP